MRVKHLASILGVALLLAAAPVSAHRQMPIPPPPPAPITVSMTGPKAVRVRVSSGLVMPCDSSDDTPIFEGKVAPNWSSTWMVSTVCVCVEQTYDDFPEVGWGQAHIECRPMMPGPGNPKFRVRSNDPIVVSLSSTHPDP